MKRLVISISLLLMLTVPAIAQKGGSRPKSLAIRATLHDSANGYPLSIASDDAGAYQGSIQPASDNGSSDIVIEGGLFGSRTRRVHFSFLEPFSGWSGTNSAPFTERTVPGHFVLKCVNRNIDVRAIPVGETRRCPLVTQFDYNRIAYRLGSNSASEHPVPVQGEDAEVACLASDLAGCRTWQIRPSGAPTFFNGDPNAKSISILFLRASDTVIGYYYTSFLIDVTK
jgi:hypothetical protein